MDRAEIVRVGTPLVLALAIVVVVIIFGLASQNPDGFEWSLFDYAGIMEPEGGFEGIWSFLGEGMIVDVATGVIGILAILFLGYVFFRITSRRSD